MTNSPEWLRGCATALVTPFDSNLKVDEECFRALLKRQISCGVKILVPCGTTGESATMTVEEDQSVIKAAVEIARESGAKVIAGTGSNDTMAAVEYTFAAKDLGADAALVVAPYYNKPSEDGMFAHFATIATSTKDFPIVLYNVPGRAASNISARTTLRLANEFPNIVGIKEASGNFSQIMEIVANRPPGFKVLAGDDATALPLICIGADGLVSVCSNEFPQEMSTMIDKALAGELETAKALHYRLLPVMEANFIEPSPAPCKFVMSEMGILSEQLRLPLVPVGETTQKRLRELLTEVRLDKTNSVGVG